MKRRPITIERQRRAHAYAVHVLRTLGRELSSGDWSPDNGERDALHERDALIVMARAMATVAELGVASVINAVDDALTDAIRRLTGG
jgi:hypothetical protein